MSEFEPMASSQPVKGEIFYLIAHREVWHDLILAARKKNEEEFEITKLNTKLENISRTASTKGNLIHEHRVSC